MDARIRILRPGPIPTGAYVLYWMQQAQRAEDNPALEHALGEANRLGLPLVVCFGLNDDYPEANLRHYAFMLEGLRETAASLAKRGIRFVLRIGAPDRLAWELGRQAALIVCDRGYLRHQRRWRQNLAEAAVCPVVEVETDLVVPLAEASTKAEYAARTLRPKILRQLERFLALPAPVETLHPADALHLAGEDPANVDALLSQLRIDRSVAPVGRWFTGGTRVAKRRFEDFVDHRLPNYAAHGNQPQTDDVSMMGPYLHFGQVSAAWLASKVRTAKVQEPNRVAYLEELVVRRELAVNFVAYTQNYDDYGCLPGWAQLSLSAHRRDPRPHRYRPEQLEAGQTHDPFWNAAMAEMRTTGFMHNYMRMYWGKRVLAWTECPEDAYAVLIRLNNRYFLDGRDPNSYAGIGWIFGLHDRAWPERPIYGKVRTMTAAGLRRKCDIKAYVAKIARRTGLPPGGETPPVGSSFSVGDFPLRGG